MGRGVGLYESALLVGTAVGPALFGALYSSGGWRTACLALAAVLLAGAAAVPLALRSLGLPERPPPEVVSRRVDVPSSEPPSGESAREPDQPRGREPDPVRAKKERRRFYEHVLLFAVGQVVLLAIGESWPALLISGELPLRALWTGQVPEDASVLTLASRIWCIVLLVDGVWSLSYTIFPAARRRYERTLPVPVGAHPAPRYTARCRHLRDPRRQHLAVLYGHCAWRRRRFPDCYTC